MAKRVACLLIVGLVMGADGPNDAAKKDVEKLQGEWKAEKAQRDGNNAPAEVLEKLVVRIKGDSLTIDDGSARDEKAAIALDPSKSPAAIDIKPIRPGRDTVLGIYKLEGDSLTLCWAKKGDRPAEFDSKEGSNHVLFVLKRVKK